MRFTSLVLLALVASLLPACRGDVDTTGAEEAVRLRLEQLSRGEYAQAWETMHPAHQAVASRDKFVECGRELQLQRDPSVETITVLEARQRTSDITEIGEVETINVQVELRTGEDARRPSFDVIDVDGTWRWVLSDGALRAFREGRCPA